MLSVVFLSVVLSERESERVRERKADKKIETWREERDLGKE